MAAQEDGDGLRDRMVLCRSLHGVHPRTRRPTGHVDGGPDRRVAGGALCPADLFFGWLQGPQARSGTPARPPNRGHFEGPEGSLGSICAADCAACRRFRRLKIKSGPIKGPLNIREEEKISVVVEDIRPRVRDEPIPVRHPDTGQGLGVHDRILADNFTFSEDIGDYCIDIVVGH